MKFSKISVVILSLVFTLVSCNRPDEEPKNQTQGVEIVLGDDSITVNGEAVTEESGNAVYIDNDIVYYESGKDFTYGEGTEADAHDKSEADAHTVVHITEAGTYTISGKLSKGQIAVDLGEDAKNDKEAVVTLVLNGIDITCTVAPAVIFYDVYECGDDENGEKDVDTSSAGANVIIADDTVNNVNGSYVARIYKPGSVVLNEEQTEVIDEKKLHKYDGAFYSKRSMNINGGEKGNGVLNITAENEGLDSELHLTVNGGNINILSGNDGINTNEDGISVTTINGGNLKIRVNGKTGEGDGIDSNGWLVINGGSVAAFACSTSADAGIDSDMGIHINGGTVVATGSMLDRIENGGQSYALFNFSQKQKGGSALTVKTADTEEIAEICPENDYSVLIYSSPNLDGGNYTLWSNGEKLQTSNGPMGGPGGNTPPHGERPEFPEGEMPEFPEGEMPEFPEGEMPEPPNGERPEPPNGERPEPPNGERPELPEGEMPEPPTYGT